jgi:hypothetical protein
MNALSASIPAYIFSVPLKSSLFHKLRNLPFVSCFSSNTRSLGSCIFGVHEQTWDRHGVRHALLYGCAVGGVGDEVENGGGGVVVECEARVRGWQEGRDGLWWGRL